MNDFQFKKLNFFKKRETKPTKSKPNSTFEKKEGKKGFWFLFIRNPFLYLFLFVIVIAYFLSYLPSKSLPVPAVGEIASSDIIAPADLTIEDKQTTEKRREEAVESILPVYQSDPNVFLITEEKIREFFDSGRNFLNEGVTRAQKTVFIRNAFDRYSLEISPQLIDMLIREKFAQNIEDSLINLIGKVSSQGIILSKNLFIHGEQEKGFTFINNRGNERVIQAGDILDIKQSQQWLTDEINALELSQRVKNILKELSHLFISANVTYDKIETDRRKLRAREEVEPVFYTIKKGKVIVRKGDEVSADVLNQIRIINQNLQEKPSWLKNFLGTFLFFGLLFFILWYYLKSLLRSEGVLRYYIALGTTFILTLLFYKLSAFLSDTFSQSSTFFLLRFTESYYYVFPYQFGVLLFAFLTQAPIAIIFLVINSLLVGYFFQANFYLMCFSLIGGFAAVYGIKHYGKTNRTSTFQTGLFLIAPINVFVILIFQLIKGNFGSFQRLTSDLVMGLLGGILSAALSFLFLPVFELSFGFVTQSKLLELTNSDLPIFRSMALEAPGSYHHSLLVSSLAEKAAEEIKLDNMLVKAGAMYHDIGKLRRPEYFIENQTKNISMHEDLKPSMSTLVIINHVKEGLEKAKKLRLPKKVRDIIAQHHGTSLVRYFFQKAKEKYDPEMHKIGEESYRYTGPTPKSKEAGLIMLADSVEAAVRSLKAPTETNIKRVISEIFNSYIQDGQLDDSHFSFKELKIIAASFLNTLDSIYHRREQYPGFDFEREGKPSGEGKNKNDRSPEPTK
ncbi:MAG: HDIG domain-containing protein [Candidatus Aminicenantes bacterium]|nr:HDIG domain-containing protein [Candidatus Aminicenantes bacterium]